MRLCSTSFLQEWAPTARILPDLQSLMKSILSVDNSWARTQTTLHQPPADLLKRALIVSTSTLGARSKKSSDAAAVASCSARQIRRSRLCPVFERLCRQTSPSPSKCVAALTTHKIVKTSFSPFSTAHFLVESLLLPCMAEALCSGTTAQATGIFWLP